MYNATKNPCNPCLSYLPKANPENPEFEHSEKLTTMALYKEEETYKIIGMCMEVHRELGAGFNEIIYKDALEIEARLCNVPVSREKPFRIHYKSQMIKRIYYADFVLFNDIIIEAKAHKAGLNTEDENQLLNYLKVSGCKVGFLVNFGMKSLKYKRMMR